METRDILELLKIMRTHTKTEKNYLGMCATALDLRYSKIITEEEQEKIERFISKNRPTPEYDSNGVYQAYFWKTGVKAPRLRWLTKQIDKLEKVKGEEK